MKNKYIKQLFEKPMDRRHFLAHVGLALLVIIGFSGIMKRLGEFAKSSTPEPDSPKTGYGQR